MKYDCEGMYPRKCCDAIIGNNLDIEVKKHDCEIRADVVVSPALRTVRIWGQIKDCEGRAAANTLVKLVRVIYVCGKMEYEGVAHTMSDCEGFYQFDVCLDDENCRYKLLVSKAATGNERVVCDDGNCDPCNPCEPCEEYVPCDYDPCECEPYPNPYSKKKY